MAATRKRPPTRRAAPRRTTRTRTRSRRRGGARGLVGSGFVMPRLPRRPVLDQRGPDGGRAGHALAVALGWVLGRARVLAPATLLLGGGALLLRPVLPALRPLRTGALCLSASVTLAVAAGTLGVSSAPGGRSASWSSAFLQSHGGVAGEALYQATHRLVQSLGVDILVVFLMLVGVILLTGASLAGALRATGSGLIDTTRRMRTLTDRSTSTPGRAGPAGGLGGEDFLAGRLPVSVPEPAPEEL